MCQLTEFPALPATYGVIDLFAGPGGLGEGFASLTSGGNHHFRIGLSVEKEGSAHRTLTLRAFLRECIRRKGRLPEEYIEFHAGLRDEPDWGKVDAVAWKHACAEARCLELGTPEAAQVIDTEIDRLKAKHDATILIGGPPCQAYSLVGRSRSKGVADYRPENDHRHFLFREYIRVLDRLRPAAFVLENVKGVLSSKVGSRQIFGEIMEDLASLGGADENLYELRALRIDEEVLRLSRIDSPYDFIVRSEEFGVPQRRHRVIVIGIRSDLADRADRVSFELRNSGEINVGDVIGDLPALRSGVSRMKDSREIWQTVVAEAAARLIEHFSSTGERDLTRELDKVAKMMRGKRSPERERKLLPPHYGQANDPLRQWLENDELIALAQHSSRSHMPADLERYLFASIFGKVRKAYAGKNDFPDSLAPDHRSWEKNIFSDRFRVQLASRPATTVTSHISKDGHYFIHPDPMQCRSLTVREAARLQTFPDDYFFLGNRTQQYVQVGNAVPPYLARQIAQLLLRLLDDAASEDRAAEPVKCEPVIS